MQCLGDLDIGIAFLVSIGFLAAGGKLCAGEARHFQDKMTAESDCCQVGCLGT